MRRDEGKIIIKIMALEERIPFNVLSRKEIKEIIDKTGA
jgi:hypothetical protein